VGTRSHSVLTIEEESFPCPGQLRVQYSSGSIFSVGGLGGITVSHFHAAAASVTPHTQLTPKNPNSVRL
jgi:hypothetical protein